MDEDCRYRDCGVDDECTFENVKIKTPCPLAGEGGGNAGVCDGKGQCVDCVETSDCSEADSLCQGNVCVPPDCANGQLDAENGETDIDCGGPNCSSCANDSDCAVPSDCLSGVCDSGGTGDCKPCDNSGNFDCQASQYCNAGSCADKKVVGATCASAAECASGQCPTDDGVCCDLACDGLCQTCSGGTCSNIPSGQDPMMECTAPQTCDGNGMCGGTGGAGGA
jgi:hypothetical protein